ncbi:MAG: tRNA (adenosine(37)-N6)-dimethylallyltransferase MiaA [Burkholderiaceae bacterium]|nr:tRNA (adenosine(37)-N6)-dimethylallyltransferase MiaA [Burkholderiaceae bacterium]
MTLAGKPLICLAGPTASGKSAIAQMLAEHLPVEIINVDSATIYRGMDIGTAKPTACEQQAVRHHLLDILDPSQSYSAAQFRQDALTCASDILARGKLPLLVGGTMLYFKVLRDGIDDLPGAEPEIRAQIAQEASARGWPALHAELAKIDTITAQRLAPNDSQRIGRALEIYRASGQPMSSLIGHKVLDPVAIRLISLEPENRQALHTRIEARFDQMLALGLVDEVKRLHERGDLNPTLPSIRCVGYRQIWDYLDGRYALAQAREQGIAATRHLAKRQLTWLRSMPDRRIVNCLADNASEQVLALVRQATQSD